ncbi:hypothetical protein P7K49_027422 [Saguinus oedipus]|uniref:Uncharacterized protein n=1 Tax=Saguinus oedipus TaxID=9490 RepID=A0ABQ9UA46_SAGOE|nr:hypothetical protein P7K49_027422 [Saguinus oedipus]
MFDPIISKPERKKIPSCKYASAEKEAQSYCFKELDHQWKTENQKEDGYVECQHRPSSPDGSCDQVYHGVS